MPYDEGLVGHWSSAPFDVGAMESGDLAFGPDGRGWAVWANAAGGLDVARFRWRCPGPGRVVIEEHWGVSGRWALTDDGDGLASVDGHGPRGDVLRTAYVLGPVEPPYGGAPLPCVTFAEPVAFCHVYARGEREVRPEQDPSFARFPYS
ncbi:hypothetical protein GCM10027168_16200 [Streptomyces capparidis]